MVNSHEIDIKKFNDVTSLPKEEYGFMIINQRSLEKEQFLQYHLRFAEYPNTNQLHHYLIKVFWTTKNNSFKNNAYI